MKSVGGPNAGRRLDSTALELPVLLFLYEYYKVQVYISKYMIMAIITYMANAVSSDFSDWSLME